MLYACPRSSFIDFEPNNSAGFGGIGPQAKSVDYQLMLFAHFSKRSLCVNTFVSPKILSTWNI